MGSKHPRRVLVLRRFGLIEHTTQHAELHHRLQLFGDRGVVGINPQFKLRHAIENEREVHVLRRLRDGVAEADFDLVRAAHSVEQADLCHPDTRVVQFLANIGGFHGVGPKHDAAIAGDLANLVEQLFKMQDFG